MSEKVTILGTGTCQIELHRMASSSLIETMGTRIVFDMGRGITLRLKQLGLRNDDVEHIILSHFHADHVSELIVFLQAACWSRIDPRSKDLHIYGPKGVKVQMMRILSLFGADELTRPHFEVHIHEIRQSRFKVNQTEIEMVSLPPCGNHGIKLSVGGKTWAFTGDSDFHEEERAFLKDVDFAVFDSGHIEDKEIIDLAVASNAKNLICTHLYRDLDCTTLQSEAMAMGFSGTISIAADLMEFCAPQFIPTILNKGLIACE
jgi:ribonuclease BN (tRNA processing enzyme)